MSPVGAFKCCIAACPSAGSSPAAEIQDSTRPPPPPPPPPRSFPLLSMQVGGTQHRPEPLREPFVGELGGGTQPCGLKVSERLFWRGAGEEGEPAPPLPGSRLGGRHEISQQIMKLSLIAGESEGRRGVWRGGSLLYRGPLQGMRSMSLEERLLSTDALFLRDPGIV